MTDNTNMTCPKCGYTRNEGDTLFMKEICPSCGIVYAKWAGDQSEKLDSKLNSNPSTDDVSDDQDGFEYDTSPTALDIAKELVFFTPDKVDSMTFYGRCLAFLLFFLWGWYFITAGIDWQLIMNSFMHSINLPFHEFGHVLFRPFGRFMTILGGSLFQLILPLGLCLAFLIKQRDTFAASIMLWWLGQSFIDLSPYIADATYRTLPLVGGMGEEAHDWGNLLTLLGWLKYDYLIANTSFFIGAVLIIISMIWSAYLLMLQKKVLQ